MTELIFQPAGYHEKVTLELLSSDYVADLRAEVAKWWETIQVWFNVFFFINVERLYLKTILLMFRVIWQWKSLVQRRC